MNILKLIIKRRERYIIEIDLNNNVILNYVLYV